jgi:hypothetical protein
MTLWTDNFMTGIMHFLCGARIAVTTIAAGGLKLECEGELR